MKAFRDKLTRLPPAWSLVLVLLSVCTALIAVSTDASGFHMASTVAIVLLSLLWAHGIYDRSHRLAENVSQAPWHRQLFVWTEIVLLVVGVLVLGFNARNVQSATGGLPALIVFPYFVCLWLAAAALVRAEGRGQAAPGATFGTFLLIVYWVIGVWFIHPRLARLDKVASSA